MKPELEQ